MSLPPDYVPWCHAHDLNPWHPDEWPPAGREAFQTWKRELAAARWVHRMKSGLWDLLSPERQAELVWEDVDWAEEPPPSRPYKRCPCHMFGNAGPATDPRLPPNTAAACLVWLEQTFRRPSS